MSKGAAAAASVDRAAKVWSLIKRRGFLFPSAGPYATRGLIDYGPLGTLLKNNLRDAWWRDEVTMRGDVHPVDTSILTPPSALRASGHLEHFTDPLVDCRLSGMRFRADHAPQLAIEEGGRIRIRAGSPAEAEQWAATVRTQHAPGARVDVRKSDVLLYVQAGGDAAAGLVLEPGVRVPDFSGLASPATNSPFLTSPRSFNLMFRTWEGSVDVVDGATSAAHRAMTSSPGSPPSLTELRGALAQQLDRSSMYLRPETAQGIFMQYKACAAALPASPPFGLAQVGRAFRNEINVEHGPFRALEFEQMEIEFFVPPGDDVTWFDHWRSRRLAWWTSLLGSRAEVRAVDHPSDKLAHYARACTDVEFKFPWGWGEIEGIANRGDFDLRCHFGDGGDGGEPLPCVIEPSAGLGRGVLAVLFDAYDEAPNTGRTVMRINPRIAPIQAAVLPLVKSRPEFVLEAEQVAARLRAAGVVVRLDANHSIGRRYARHDEIGTPVCLTIDGAEPSGTMTLRDRDSGAQERIHVDHIVERVKTLTGRL